MKDRGSLLCFAAILAAAILVLQPVAIAHALPMRLVDPDAGRRKYTPYDAAEIERIVYRPGDVIIVAGFVTTDTMPIIKIVNPKGAFYKIDRISVDDDGFFIYNFTIGGKLAPPGKYKVEIKYNRSMTVGASEQNEKILRGIFVLLPEKKVR